MYRKSLVLFAVLAVLTATTTSVFANNDCFYGVKMVETEGLRTWVQKASKDSGWLTIPTNALPLRITALNSNSGDYFVAEIRKNIFNDRCAFIVSKYGESISGYATFVRTENECIIQLTNGKVLTLKKDRNTIYAGFHFHE
ncbi:MAG: hypothetical protein ABH887_00020 [bacterium]